MMTVLVAKNSYIEYKSKGDKYKNLSPKDYLNMIRPYLRDLINDHKTPIRTDEVINNESQFAEWKIQLVMLNNCVSSKHFEETLYLYSASKPVEIFMDSNTDDIVDELFDSILQRFQKSRETSNK